MTSVVDHYRQVRDSHPAAPVAILDRATVEEALRLAPARCPNPADPEREIWMKAGEHRLALRLHSLLHQQEDADLL